MKAHTLGKAERLYSNKIIQELFAKGSSFYLHPFKVILLKNVDQLTENHQILVSVSKRNFKKAVDRNTIKRRIKEGYRLQKEVLQPNPKLIIAYLYISKEILPSEVIHKSVNVALKKITNVFRLNNPSF